MTHANPFFEPWNTPFELPPFDRIRPEHFPPAFDRGMAEQQAEVAAIAGAAAPPDFANTIEALERSGKLLNRVGRVFHNLTSSATNEALDQIDRDCAEARGAPDAGMLMPGCSASTRCIGERERRPVARQLRLGGTISALCATARNSAGRKTRWRRLERLATCTLFGQNVLHDEDEWRLVLDADELDGCPISRAT